MSKRNVVIHRKKKVMIRNAAGMLFEKWPETCPSCKKSLRIENVKLNESELSQFNVDPDDPALYAVMQIWNTKANTRAAWNCMLCNHRWKDGAEEC